MRLSIIAVGTKMPAWVEQGVEEYGRRMPRELKLEWREIPLARRGKGDRQIGRNGRFADTALA